MQGRVKFFNVQKGFGFIKGDDGRDVFLHHTTLKAAGFKDLSEGEILEYNVKETAKGLQAENLRRPA